MPSLHSSLMLLLEKDLVTTSGNLIFVAVTQGTPPDCLDPEDSRAYSPGSHRTMPSGERTLRLPLPNTASGNSLKSTGFMQKRLIRLSSQFWPQGQATHLRADCNSFQRPQGIDIIFKLPLVHSQVPVKGSFYVYLLPICVWGDVSATQETSLITCLWRPEKLVSLDPTGL